MVISPYQAITEIPTMRIRSLVRSMAGLAIAVLLQACPSIPPGKDLVTAVCQCKDECAGGGLIGLNGAACTDASSQANVDKALEILCDGKETIGFNVCKIVDCVPTFPSTIRGGCPANSGKFKTGDFGQTVANAVAPSKVDISGGDIRPFTIAPQSFTISTTQDGSNLVFTYIAGSLGTTTFKTAGIFGDSEHTLRDGLLFGALFSTALQPGGAYVVPSNAEFFVTAVLDGDRLAVPLTNLNLGGVYDEAAGLFTLKGTVKAAGADINMAVDLVFEFSNRPPRAAAGPDQTVECSSGTRTGTAHLSGAASSDPDGNGDITRYTWYLDGTEAATGPEADVLAGLGAHEVKLIVSDRKGSFGGDSLALNVADTTAPRIEIVQPRPGPYPHSGTLVLDYKVTDVCTGVDRFTPLLDGAGTVGGHGLQPGQAIHLLTELALGEHTFTVSAADKQGNQSSATVTFTIVVTPESIQEAVKQLVASGAITMESQALLGRLANAAKQYRGKNCRAAGNVYQSFIQTLNAQRGKKVDPRAADILTADAQFLIDRCPQLFP